jgi:hypothetical protein
MTKPTRVAPCGRSEARARARAAAAYLEVALLTLDEHSRDEFLNVAAGDAVLAGIAASDAICCTKIGRRHRGDDHRGASELLKTATPDGSRLATTLSRLLDLKNEAHYGVMVVSARKALDAVRWATTLVNRATDEIER